MNLIEILRFSRLLWGGGEWSREGEAHGGIVTWESIQVFNYLAEEEGIIAPSAPTSPNSSNSGKRLGSKV